MGKLFFAGLALAVLCLVFLGWLSQEVLRGNGLAFDEPVRALIHQHAAPELTAAMIGASALGSSAALIAMTAMVLVWLWRARRKRAMTLFAVTMAGAFLLDASLKLSFERARPVSFFGYPVPNSYSFPSGHALLSVCLFGFVAAAAAARLRRRAAHVAVWASAAALALAIGYSRVYLGVHYPSDVLAGYAVAVVWLSAVVYGHWLVRRRRGERL